MKVILTVASIFFAVIGYSLCKAAGDADRQSERMWNEVHRGEYLCNDKCPFWYLKDGITYCKIDKERCNYDNSK